MVAKVAFERESRLGLSASSLSGGGRLASLAISIFGLATANVPPKDATDLP